MCALETKILNFAYQFLKKWRACKSSKKTFLAKYKEWLEIDFEFPCHNINEAEVNIPIFENFEDETEGRPCKVYQDLSERSKRRKVQNVSKTMERELASRALAHKYDEENMQKQAEIIRKVDKASPKRVNRIIGSIPTLKKN